MCERTGSPAVLPWALLPSCGFCAAPCLFPSIPALAAGLALHLVWFVGCATLIPTGGPPLVIEATYVMRALQVGLAI